MGEGRRRGVERIEAFALAELADAPRLEAGWDARTWSRQRWQIIMVIWSFRLPPEFNVRRMDIIRRLAQKAQAQEPQPPITCLRFSPSRA